MDNEISIAGLTGAAVLAALYNAARPQGMGFLHYQPGDITEKQAESALRDERNYFDYLMGRVMKVEIPRDVTDTSTIDTRLFDRDNGRGAGELAIASVRVWGSPSNPIIDALHRDGVTSAATLAKAEMNRDDEQTVHDGVATFRIGLAGVKDKLGPAVERALASKGDA